MGLFGGKKKAGTSYALIDIGSSTVGGALAYVSENEPPTLYYTERYTIHAHEGEENAAAMLRTLEELAGVLVTKGAPILRKEVGSGHVDKVLVSVGAPWQKTTVRTEHVNRPKPFIFTKAILTETVQKSVQVPEGYRKSGESVIATQLNGYEIAKPFGKRISRADIIVLSSYLDEKIAKAVETTLRKTYHTHALTLTAFAPVAYAVFRDIFPHEKDFLVLHVCAESTDIAYVKRGLLVSVSDIEHGTNELTRGASTAARKLAHAPGWSPNTILDPLQNQKYETEVEEVQKQWLGILNTTFQDFSKRHALPRTLFLLAHDDVRDYLRNVLDAPALRSLWLTDDPLRIIPVAHAQFSSFVLTRGEAQGDVFLSFLALYARKDKSL